MADFTRAARSLVGAALLVTGLAACGADGITGPVVPQAPTRKLVVDQPLTNLSPVDDVVEFPDVVNEVPFPFPNPCTGEAVEGTVVARDHMTFNKNTFHLHVHSKFQFDGEGLPRPDGSRTQYHGQGEDMFQVNVHPTGGEETHVTTIIIKARNSLTGESGDDFRMHITEHITFKPPGGPPGATVNHIRTECN